MRIFLIVDILLFCALASVNGGDNLHIKQDYSPCADSSLSYCTSLLTRVLEKHDLGFVTTEDGLNNLCSEMMVGIRCVEDFIGNCSSPEQRSRFHLTASGALESSQQLCTENSQLRNEYLSHSSCFREIALNDVACASQYNGIMDQMINLTDSDIEEAQTTLSKICCGYGEFMSCTQEFVTKIPLCSNGSTKFIQEYLERNIGSPLMDRCKPSCNTSNKSNLHFKHFPLVLTLLLNLSRRK